MTSESHRAWRDSQLLPLWLDNDRRPPPRDALNGTVAADYLIVGGGFTGLWAALRAAERFPRARVVLIEADRVAEHASGRNGGFCEPSITHGEANGIARWPDEYCTLEELGNRNFEEIEEAIVRYGIDCDFRRVKSLTVATRSHEVEGLEPDMPGFLGAHAVREIVDSPTYLAGRITEGAATVDPARLAWGLADACTSLGVRIYENTRLVSLARGSHGVRASTEHGTVEAASVVLATNAFPNPLKRLRMFTVPVFDYVLATEPLTEAQLATTGWDTSIAITDSGNQFHYYRITPDRRILFGGYDAVYHYGRSIKDEHYDRAETFDTLAAHFYETFPQLSGVRFTHRWSGVIDTSSRFCALFGTAMRGNLAYATGFTGLGVAASRFAADVMLDLLVGSVTERTSMKMVRSKPIPFPPEPFAQLAISFTQRSMSRADRTGRRNLWLRLLDRLGMGFDS